MEFPSDEIRDEFHKLETITQIICNILETSAFEHGLGSAILDIDPALNFVVMYICKADREVGKAITTKVNDRFPVIHQDRIEIIAGVAPNKEPINNVCYQDTKDCELFYVNVINPNDLDYKNSLDA